MTIQDWLICSPRRDTFLRDIDASDAELWRLILWVKRQDMRVALFSLRRLLRARHTLSEQMDSWRAVCFCARLWVWGLAESVLEFLRALLFPGIVLRHDVREDNDTSWKEETDAD